MTRPRLWRTALALDTLLAQVNAHAPKRSKLSDGSIASEAHTKQNPTSDHEPRIDDPDSDYWIVTARDFTDDPNDGFSCEEFVTQLVATKDPRIKYIIWNGRIWSPSRGWQKYTGSNPHRKHAHVSVRAENSMYDDGRNFAIWTVRVPNSTVPITSTRLTLREGAKGDEVKLLQETLNKNYPAYSKLKVDSDFGPATEKVVREFQKRAGLSVDGVVGPRTWRALGL